MADKIQPTPAAGMYVFECPACGCLHSFQTPIWTWNGSMDKPTVRPSIRVHMEDGDQVKCCHFFVREGRIEFCSDCTHDMAGKTVDMLDIE